MGETLDAELLVCCSTGSGLCRQGPAHAAGPGTPRQGMRVEDLVTISFHRLQSKERRTAYREVLQPPFQSHQSDAVSCREEIVDFHLRPPVLTCPSS